MKKKTIFSIGVVCILITTFALTLVGFTLTGKGISEMPYSHTKAICNAKNECQDFLIVCKNGAIKSLEPISDLVKFGENWNDNRDKKGFCYNK